MNKTYSEKLRDPRWQKRRLEIFSRDNWSCLDCQDKTTELQVHHLKYIYGKDPWDYEDSLLRTLCAVCHGLTHFKPVVKPINHVPEKKIKEPVVLPYDTVEGSLLKVLLLSGDLPITPKSKYLTTRYTKIFEFIIGEFIRYDLKFETKEFQEMYDIIGFSFYNTPGYVPDIELFLNNDNPVIQAFSRYTVESIYPISPKWAKFGIFPPAPDIEARSVAVNTVFHFQLRKINAVITAKQRELIGASYEDSLVIMKDVQELDKIKTEIQTNKLYWG